VALTSVPSSIGAHELIFDCRGQSISESIERLLWFAIEIMPLAAGWFTPVG
jgi:hypothetical protein